MGMPQEGNTVDAATVVTAVRQNGDVTGSKNSDVSLRVFYDDSTAVAETANLDGKRAFE